MHRLGTELSDDVEHDHGSHKGKTGNQDGGGSDL